MTRFEGVRDHAYAIAKQNTDSAFALVEKMARGTKYAGAFDT